jgi:hypothetical protein
MPETLPSTGDAALDFALEAGPRALTPDLPLAARLAIAKSSALGPYKEACKQMAQEQLARVHADMERVCMENRVIERTSKALPTFIPYCRFPVSFVDEMEKIYGIGCLSDNDFREDTLKHHPGLRINVRRGIKGQEYAGNGR